MTAGLPTPLRLTPAMRLRASRDFAHIKAQGRRLVRGCLIANWRELPVGTSSRVGVITGRKLGNAVIRSRARRLLREVFRLHQHDFKQPIELVLVARSSIVHKPMAGVEHDYLSALRQAQLMLNPA